MNLLQLDPPVPLDTPKGKGIAHFLIDYSIEQNLYWVVFIDETGECWTFSNPEIRAQKNITMGRLCNRKNARSTSEKDYSSYRNNVIQ